MNTIKFTYLFAFLLFANNIQAQNISVKVSKEEIEVGETVLATYTLDGDVQEFVKPKFNGFRVYQTGQSTHRSIINGKVSKSVSYSFSLVGLEVGTFEIDPAKAKINGKHVQSASFKVKVVASSTSSSSQQPKLSSSQPNQQITTSASENWEDNILLLASVDKKKVYVGEQITITYKLLRRLNLQSIGIESLPMFKGFLSEEMQIPNNQTEGRMEYNGKEFYFTAFRKVALFASKSGTHAIDPLIVNGVALVPEKDPFFGTTFFSSVVPQEIRVASNSLRIEVLELPTTNQPKNFSGAVGDFQAKRKIAPLQITQGESVKMDISISGWGNLKAITRPSFSNDRHFDVYDPKITDHAKKNGEQYGGERMFEYAIVPHKSGELVIPSYEFVYFDPQKKSYISDILPEVKLHVTPSSDPIDNDRGDEFTFNDSLKGSLSETRENYTLPILGVIAGLPLLAFIVFLVRRKKSKDNELKKHATITEWPDLTQFPEKEQYTVLAKTLREKLKKTIAPNATTDQNIIDKIQDQPLRQKVAFVLVSCDRAAYSPMGASSIQELERIAQAAFIEISNSDQV